MKRLNIRSLTTLILFGIIFVAYGPASSARADDNIVFISPTNNATVNVGPLNSKLQVKFKTNNSFLPVSATLTLNGNTTVVTDFAFDGINVEYTAEFAVSTGNYANTSVKIDARKPAQSGSPAVDDSRTVTGITVNKQ